MRRPALLGLILGLPLLLAGCSGVGTYLGDTFTWTGTDPNMPLGDSENTRRARGEPVAMQPVLPEPGDIWPGPPPPMPTLSDVEKLENMNPNSPPTQTAPDLPDHRQPRGSSTPQPGAQPGLPPIATPSPGTPTLPPELQPSPRRGTTVQTPNGNSTVTGGTNNYRTTTPPGGVGGGQGILIPNGNGTSTLIGPDGSVTTVPTPK